MQILLLWSGNLPLDLSLFFVINEAASELVQYGINLFTAMISHVHPQLTVVEDHLKRITEVKDLHGNRMTIDMRGCGRERS